MATSYKTPGVYINEVSTLPTSVAQVPTAIPAFIGYTEFAKDLDGSSLTDIPKRISSMVEYIQFFGGSSRAQETASGVVDKKPKVILDEANGYAIDKINVSFKFILYQSISMYFANGGGACYVVSVGDYSYTLTEALKQAALIDGLSRLEKEDEPTLLLVPDAAILTTASLLGGLQKEMLIQCNKLKDRFAIMDLIEDASTSNLGEANFRGQVGMQYLKYGAAYGPHLESSLSYDLLFSDLVIEKKTPPGTSALSELNAPAMLAITNAKLSLTLITSTESSSVSYLAGFDAIVSSFTFTKLANKMLKIIDVANELRALVGGMASADLNLSAASFVKADTQLEAIIRQVRAYASGYDDLVGPASTVVEDLVFNTPPNPFDGGPTDFISAIPPSMVASDFDYDLASVLPDSSIFVGTSVDQRVTAANPVLRQLLLDALAIFTELKAEANRHIRLLDDSFALVDPIYANIKRTIAAKGIIVPPSGAVAGAYVATDADRGVWKAPANISLNNVVRPTIKIDNVAQDLLNIDATTGKSINIIRSFTGKGTLIWGARTLAGNDNEWRYIPVRRLFNTVEESVKKATEFVVFEPNDGNTWLRTKTMIQNYLTGLWRQGALAGAKPEDAFFVNVGLGETMTAQDILEGKMIVEIGLAAVRPAEFIILRFSHKLQES